MATKLLDCRCGSEPIRLCGNLKDDEWVAIVVCRTPEKHTSCEMLASLAAGVSDEEAATKAEICWEGLNAPPRSTLS